MKKHVLQLQMRVGGVKVTLDQCEGVRSHTCSTNQSFLLHMKHPLGRKLSIANILQLAMPLYFPIMLA